MKTLQRLQQGANSCVADSLADGISCQFKAAMIKHLKTTVSNDSSHEGKPQIPRKIFLISRINKPFTVKKQFLFSKINFLVRASPQQQELMVARIICLSFDSVHTKKSKNSSLKFLRESH